MRRITKWIQDHKAYSNPVFGLMLTINVMVLPTFQAAAGMDEPVQSVVLNAQDVQDALDAMKVGVSSERALLEQSKAYREWGRQQVHVYETLFDTPYDYDNALYLLDEDVDESKVFMPIAGTMITGERYSLRCVMLAQYDYAQDPQVSPEVVSEYDNHDFSYISVKGTMSAGNGSVHIDGVIFQATTEDGDRNRMLLIIGITDQTVIDIYEEGNVSNLLMSNPADPGDERIFPDMPLEIDTSPPTECEEAFRDAERVYLREIGDAKREHDTCSQNVNIVLKWALLGCVGVGLVTFLVSSVSGPAAVALSLRAGGGCAGLALVTAAGAHEVCDNTLKGAIRQAGIDLDYNYQAARDQWGADCPEEAV